MYGVKLMISGHLFDEHSAPHVFEDDEIADQIEEPPLFKDAFEHDLQFRQTCSFVFSGDGSPRLEPFFVCADGSNAPLHTVGYDKSDVGGKERSDFHLVRLKLLERCPDR